MTASRDPFSGLTDIPPEQRWVDVLLDNWRAWSRTSRRSRTTAPMWRMAQAQVDASRYRRPVEPREVEAVEQAIRTLPPMHRQAMRWFYLQGGSPFAACRSIGCSKRDLVTIVRDARGRIGQALSAAGVRHA